MEIGNEYLGIYAKTSPSYLGSNMPSVITMVEHKPRGLTSYASSGWYSTIGTCLHGSFGGCCGARQLSGWSGQFSYQGNIEHRKADFLTVFLRTQGIQYTNYFIATDEQINRNRNGPLKLLLEMGAAMVDDTPNQVHGPNKMCLFVWAPALHKDKLKKYVTFYSERRNTERDEYNRFVVEPKYFSDLSEEDRKKYIEGEEAQYFKKLNDEVELARQKSATFTKTQTWRTYASQLAMNWRYMSDEEKQAVQASGLYRLMPTETVIQSVELIKLRNEAADLKAQIKKLQESNKVITPKRDAMGRFTKIIMNKAI